MSSAIRVGIAAVAMLAGAGVAAAADSAPRNFTAHQHSSSTTGSATNATNGLKLTSTQERVVYLSVTQRRTRPSAPEGFTAAVGAVVPASIRLRPLPRNAVKQVPELEAYDYAILPDQVLIVDPVAKTIVAVIN